MSGSNEYTDAVEIVSIDSSLSGRSIDPFPYKVESPVTVWAAGKVLVCGGNFIKAYLQLDKLILMS